MIISQTYSFSKLKSYKFETINSAIDASRGVRSGRLCLSDEEIGEDAVLLHYTPQ